MCCLTKEETLQTYRVLLEFERLIDKDDPCFQEEDNKVLIWGIYLVLASPLLHIVYGLIFK
jgi:hypothetical protein